MTASVEEEVYKVGINKELNRIERVYSINLDNIKQLINDGKYLDASRELKQDFWMADSTKINGNFEEFKVDMRFLASELLVVNRKFNNE